MTWCIECGEPLDPDALPGHALGPTRSDTIARQDRRAAGRGHWEWVLGTGLLLAVLLAGTVDWWQQEHGATAYHRGAAAATAAHWAGALAAFEQAGDYRDAPARAAAARSTLEQLEQQYSAATTAAGQGDWLAAARAYSAVAALQPDFRDVVARLPAARATLLQQQAAGTLYGTSGPGAGLFLARGTGLAPWRLPGSDGSSRVRLYAGGGRWALYDGTIWPATGAHADPTHRVLFLADLADRAAPLVTRLPADLPPDGTALATPGGFWWTSSHLPGAGVVYYDYATGQVQSPALTPGWSLVAADSAHGWLLLAYSDSLLDGTPRTYLYLSNAAGVLTTPVTVVDGLVQDAQVSPDGRYVLFTNVLSQRRLSDRALQLVLVRLDVPRDSPPPARRVSVLDVLRLPDGTDADQVRLAARFVPGSGPTRILSDHTDYNGRRQTLYDMGTGLQATVWGGLPGPRTPSTFDLSATGTLVLTQHREAWATRLVVQPVAQLTTKRDLRVPTDGESLVSARLVAQDSDLLITVTGPHPSRSRQVVTLYSALLPPDEAPGPPTMLYSGVYDPAVVPSPLPSLAPGGAMLLYLTPNGTLEATTLDGTVRGPVAQAVRRLWVP
jgi:hypothetical protein